MTPREEHLREFYFVTSLVLAALGTAVAILLHQHPTALVTVLSEFASVW